MNPNSSIYFIPNCHMICSRKRLMLTVRKKRPGALLRVELPEVLVQGAVEESTVDPNGPVRCIPNSHMLTTCRGTRRHDVCPRGGGVPPQVIEVVDTIVATMDPKHSIWIPNSHVIPSRHRCLIQLSLFPAASVKVKHPQLLREVTVASSVDPKFMSGSSMERCDVHGTS